jgi:hypothetical protein
MLQSWVGLSLVLHTFVAMGVPTFDRLSLFEYYQAAMNCSYIHGNCKSPILGTA